MAAPRLSSWVHPTNTSNAATIYPYEIAEKSPQPQFEGKMTMSVEG
jgi:hypothetical protein